MFLQNEGSKFITGDAKMASLDLPDESVDMVFTDPVYDNIEDYKWLAQEAARVLKPHKPLLVWCSLIGQYNIQRVIREYLTFRFPLYYTVVAKSAPLFYYKVNCWTTPCLVFSKGDYKPRDWVVGTMTSHNQRDTSYKWNKNEAPISEWLSKISYPNDLIWDPFSGYGTVPVVCIKWGRRYFASEINPEVAEQAKERIRCTKPYLF